MTYPDSVQFLYSLGNEIKTAKFGLERIRTVLAELGEPQRALRVVHVAGTNGKGSTCAMIETALRAAGYRTGLYTSPHLVEPTERIQIGGVPASNDQFTAAFETVHETAERLLVQGRIDLHPTYFETVTAMAFLLFEQAKVEIAVVEVGLGGRLDATNVVEPELCVITPVDFDHERFLGSTIEQIAAEKAGILKPGVPAVFAAQRGEADAVLTGTAARLGVAVTRTRDIGELPVEPPLAGGHQVENTRAAVAALRLLNVDPAGIAQTRWPGRLERVHERPDVVLDGAHNPAGARALARYIASEYEGWPVWMIFGTMRDKSVGEIAEILFPLADRLILTAPATARAMSPDALRLSVEHPDMQVAASVPEAVELARQAPPETAIFVTGSLFVVGEARPLFVK